MLLSDFKKIQWHLHPQNPLVHPPALSPLIADPTLVTPDISPDGLWHMFAHSVWGIHHHTSSDGIEWTRLDRPVSGALRPYIFKEGDTFYLYYEKVGALSMALSMLPIRKWYSWVEVRSSKDLIHWSEAKVLLRPEVHFSKEQNGAAVSNPCMVKTADGQYLLYFSAGLVHVPDCGFNEPRHIGCAFGNRPDGPFKMLEEPVLSPDAHDRWNNLGAGSMKVLMISDGFVGFQNGIYLNDGISGSSIRLMSSTNGQEWLPMDGQPILAPSGNGWMASHIYACDVRFFENIWYLYFNARTTAHWTKGIEKIGLATGSISS
jgi:hypothetical protein